MSNLFIKSVQHPCMNWEAVSQSTATTTTTILTAAPTAARQFKKTLQQFHNITTEPAKGITR